MYKKKLTTSFFDSNNTAKKQKRTFDYRNKENLAKFAPADVFKQANKICDQTTTKLNSFAFTATRKASALSEVRTPSKPPSVIAPLDIEGKTVEPRSSQAEDRVKWRISPPPQNLKCPSDQKLTIKEMFDIYQASQHSTETPLRQIDRSNDLWSRYDSAEPLPYLDLELSPSSRVTPKSDTKLRRTTSLPVWVSNSRDRKRKRPGTPCTHDESMVRSMIQQVQTALVKEDDIRVVACDVPVVEHACEARRDDPNSADRRRRVQIHSDDFEDDILDDADLLSLVGCGSAAPNKSIFDPLPSGKGTETPNSNSRRHSMEVLVDKVSISRDTCVQEDPDVTSDYGIDFEEDDFAEVDPSSTLKLEQTACARPPVVQVFPTNIEKQLTPAELLDGLDDDTFSDFEVMEHRDVSVHSITKVEREAGDLESRGISSVKLELRNRNGECKRAVLQGDWVDMNLQVDDDLRFHGPWVDSSFFIATNQIGQVIIHPDTLVSCTSIADSHTCMRKSVLQDRVRATSSLSKALIYGSILHSMLQASLFDGDFSDVRLRKEIDVQIAGNLEKLFLVEESVETATDYLCSKVIMLQRWAQTFFGKEKSGRVEPMRGKASLRQISVGVRKVLDIEERFWSPLYGIKGNVDVTAEMNVSIDKQRSIMLGPLEFKTGKTEYQQSSYRAQVMLYTLLMSERYGVDVSAGFLYYLETGQLTRVAALHNEMRGLLIMRNELARNMKNKTIPAMISEKRICGSCYAAEACFTYSKTLDHGERTASSIEALLESKTAHLTTRDVEFFRKWESLITKEEGEMFRFRKELWHMTSTERAKLNRCFGDLVVVPNSESYDPTYGKMNQWTYKLQHAVSGATFPQSQISHHEPIIVSDENGSFAISCGFVVSITARYITVIVDRPLRDSRAKQQGFDQAHAQIYRGTNAAGGVENLVRYRLDRDEFKNGMGIVRNNLISLLLNPASKNANPSTDRHKNLIVDLVEPKFDTKPLCCPHPSQSTQDALNVDQIRARNLIMSARDYALILGMPGTGKTTTIAQIIRSLVNAGKSVLLTSYTHSAVDTIILKLAGHNIKILRLGSYSKINPELSKIVQTEQHDAKNFDDLQNHYDSPNVVATTCLSINHAIFQKRRFDYCIFDEASQATLPVCLGPLRYADKFVLVGDHYQLPPLVKDFEARKQGLDVSLFKILCEAHPKAVVELQHQYRMNADIMSISNQLIYGGRLTCGTKALENRKLTSFDLGHLSGFHETSHGFGGRCSGKNCWLEHALLPDRGVVYLNTDPIIGAKEVKTRDQVINNGESIIVSHLVEGLIRCGLKDSDIGIISPYRSQLGVLQQDLSRHSGVMIDTADKFQGRDKECIVVSLVRSNEQRNIGELLRDWRRINVAFTRAKSKMVIIGSQDTLANDRLLNDFLQLVHHRGWAYDLPPDTLTAHGLAPAIASQKSRETPAATRREVTNTTRSTRVNTAGYKAILSNRPILRDVLNELQ